jgi:large subunit ribosomal protein L5
MPKSRLEELYNKNIRPALKTKLGLKNIMEVPKLSKIVLNVGVKEAVTDSKVLKVVSDVIAKIAGQAPVRTIAKKSIAGFKIREGMPLGVMVTLRRERMYDFFDKLINLALPNVRDFQGLSIKMDGRGNYNLGLKEWTIFPETERGTFENVYGLNITIHTTAGQDDYALELLKGFGMPFKKVNK